MDEPIRVLNVTRVFNAAGIESFIMNMYRNIDRSKVQFDFLVMSDEKSCYEDEIKVLGGKKYTINVKEDNTFLRIQKESFELYKFLLAHKYEIVHVHYTTPLRAPYLLAAKKAKVPVRIYHSHSAVVSGKSKGKLLIYNYYKNKLSKWATNWFACSKAAAEWMYKDELISAGKVQIIYNGIDVRRFKYRQDMRDKLRKVLDLEQNFVIMHTGRFLPQKNHTFIIDVFSEIKKRDSTAKLILLGEGSLQEPMQKKVLDLGLREDVVFMGVKKNVEDYLSFADCYIMPSLYEGLPVAAVEAECSGLPCVMSSNITREVELTPNAIFLSLDKPAEYWATEILKTKEINRMDGSKDVAQAGYDVKDVARMLQDQYIEMVRKG